ncbi:tripartite motif-containing protein 45 isoform X2 [Falco biarmicus]|uniref:tripartite motif-containing protein 45 isoform X2 n=1 Tax=Falco biarmicus TaxID=345155 RepID=UPI0024BD5AC0|nr:tripartite motif-containing protein 45 isoform X2 [Falco biarmicus]
MAAGPRCPLCPLCAEPCAEPRLLPCLHSLCAPCLRRLGPLGQPGRPVLCPLCDAEVALPPGGVGQLVPDYLALRRGGAAGCDLCADGAAVRRCLTCGAALCLFCCQAHRRQKKTASHAVTELVSSKDCNQARKPLFCPSHPTEELRLFCEQCDQPVCRDCVADRHRQHTCDFTGNAIHRHGEALQELLRSTQQHMGTLEGVLSHIDDMVSAVRDRAEAVAAEIRQFASGYVKAIEEHRDRLLKQLEDLKVQKENLLHLQKAQMQQLLLDMRTGVEYTEHLLTSGSDLEILITKGVVASRLAKLNSVAYNTRPSVDDGIRFSPQERAGQCFGYEVFGAIINKVVDPARCTLHGEAPAEIAVGVTGIDDFMDICLLRTWSRASKQIMFRPAHRTQPAVVGNGLRRADETDPGLVRSFQSQTAGAEVCAWRGCSSSLLVAWCTLRPSGEMPAGLRGAGRKTTLVLTDL